MRPLLLDRAKPCASPRRRNQDGDKDRDVASSSRDVVHVEDSQDMTEEGVAVPVAVLADGSTRALTQEEQEEIAAHEEDERVAAEAGQMGAALGSCAEGTRGS